jgi:outer membrane protein TolC
MAAATEEPIGFPPHPVVSEGKASTPLPVSQPEPTDKPLPINLPSALQLAEASPLVIAAAQASLEAAVAAWDRAKVQWLPSFYAGAGYYRHDGATQGQSGNFYVNTKNQYLEGGGFKSIVSGTDAIFAPLAAKQIVRARTADVQAARNEALLAVAQAYFNVQRARGRLAGAQDIVDKGIALRDKVKDLKLGLVAPIDVNRARALLADFEQIIAEDREAWRVASADLAQVLRLDPAALVAPLEPPHLQVTLIPLQTPVDSLIPIGLTNRPELASQQALVQAALVRIRQEKMRPLIPSLILDGNPGAVGPGDYFMGGLFSSDVNGTHNPTLGRDDISAGIVWGVENLGFGNRASVRGRQAERQQMLVELFRIQDQVAGDVARAHAQLVSAAKRISLAETELSEAQSAYAGSIRDLGEVVQVGDAKVQLERTLDVITSLQSLAKAYDNYFASANDYNIAQFRLYRALGYPADVLSSLPNSSAPPH